MPNKKDDEYYVIRAQNGDNQALDHIIRKYKSLVRSRAHSYYIMGSDKEDIIQEGMIGLYKAVRDFDNRASFKNFASICITRQIITAVKNATRKKHMPLNSYISLNASYNEEVIESCLEDINSNPEDLILNKENDSDVEKVMSKVLSDFEKQVLKLYIDGKKYYEIANILGKDSKAIDNAIQRVKKKMVKTLET